MTLTGTPSATAAAPAAPARRRRALSWIAIAVVVILIGITAAWMSGLFREPARGLLDPDATAPDGGRALAEILREQGLEVQLVRDLPAARAAVGTDTTLLLGDAAALSDAELTDLTGAAADVVLAQPRARDLRMLLDAAPAGVGDGTAFPQCELADALRSGPIDPGAVFEPSATARTGDTACYPSGSGYGLVATETGNGRSVAVDAATLFTNEHLADVGNAALAVNLLGREPRVVWFLPTTLGAAGTATLGELTPEWVTPVLVLLAVAAVAAGIWRGRRFGPLVAETLPVTVRAGETTTGRARLYARSADAGHAADLLRRAARRRCGALAGVGPTASAEAVADATAALTGRSTREVLALLDGAAPSNDRDLVGLADALRDLETVLHGAVTPATPPGRILE